MVRSARQKLFDTISVNGLLVMVCVVSLFPVAYALTTSFKPQFEVLTRPPMFFPQQWTVEGYEEVIFNTDLIRYHLVNTFVNAFGGSVLTVAIAVLASYAFSRYRFRGSKVLQLLILGLIMIPSLTNLVPLYRMASELGLLNTNVWMISVYIAGGLPWSIWVLKAFFDSIPAELEEAAQIDGCSVLMSLWYVVVPLSAPGMVTAFLMEFVFNWNEFLVAVTMLTKNTAKTATVGLWSFQASFETAFHVWMAACILIMLPVIVAFLIVRRSFFQAILQGALKG